MGAVKFSKQSVRPNPLEIDYWIDVSDDPAGGKIKYFNGYAWVDLVSANGAVVNLNGYYDKVQTNKMLADKASVELVESKVDKTDIATVIKNISFTENDETGVQMILLQYDNTTVGVTLPTASSTSSGVITAETFQDLVKQYQLQDLYSEMYDKLAEIRSQYQEKLTAGKNISISSNNVISADVESAVDSAVTQLEEKIDIETQRAIAVENRIENRVDQHYSETDSTLALKADKSDTYTKSQVDAKLSGIYKVKGSVAYEDLPTVGNIAGDAYNINNSFTLGDVMYPAGTNVVYTDYGWDVLSGTFDTVKLEEDIQTVADNLAKETLRAIEAETYNSNSIITLTNTTADLSTKLNTLNGNVYTKTEINDMVDGYLPLSGGALSGELLISKTTYPHMTLNASDGAPAILLAINNENKGYLGYSKTAGTYLYNSACNKYLGLKDDGTLYYNGVTILDASNFATYALPLSGGTINGILTVTNNSDTVFELNSTTGYPAILFQLNGTNIARIAANLNDGYLYRTTATWDNSYKIWDEGNFNPSNYVPVAGGVEMTGILAIKTSGTILSIRSANGGTPYINFRSYIDGTNTDLGDLGVDTNKNLIYFNGGWKKVWHEGNFNPSNYLPLSGGTLNNNYLNIGKEDNINGAYFRITNNTSSTNDYGTYLRHYNNGAYKALNITNNGLDYSDNGTDYKVWHAGNDGSGSGLDADKLDGKHEWNGVLYTQSVSMSDTTNAVWYMKVVLDLTYNSVMQKIVVKPDYNNINGKVILEFDSYRSPLGYVAKVTNYNGCNCTGFIYTQDSNNSTGETRAVVYLRFVGHTSAYVTVYSTALILESSKVSVSEGSAMSFVDLTNKTQHILTNYEFNASSATKLATARTIWGQSFDGTGDVTGNLKLPNASSVLFNDTDGTTNIALSFSGSNTLSLGYGTSAKGFETYIYGSSIFFRYSPSRTTGLILNSSGNVTIGSSDLASTNYKLYVNGATYLGNNLVMSNNRSLYWEDTNGTVVDSLFVSNSNNFHIGYGVAVSGYNTYLDGNKITFRYGTTPSDGMVLNSIGNVGIGTTSPSEKLHVAGNILATGTITQQSQRDLKDVIDEKVLSLDDMSTIKPTRFKWKDGRDEDVHYGGIAEDIQQVIPEVVHTSGDNLTVEYNTAAFVMVASLVEHVKELTQRISSLEKECEQLRNAIA